MSMTYDPADAAVAALPWNITYLVILVFLSRGMDEADHALSLSEMSQHKFRSTSPPSPALPCKQPALPTIVMKTRRQRFVSPIC